MPRRRVASPRPMRGSCAVLWCTRSVPPVQAGLKRQSERFLKRSCPQLLFRSCYYDGLSCSRQVLLRTYAEVAQPTRDGEHDMAKRYEQIADTLRAEIRAGQL